MEEEATTPVQTAPEETDSTQTAPEPSKPANKEEGGSLLTLLTVLLVLVGAADVALWGVAGYYFLLG